MEKHLHLEWDEKMLGVQSRKRTLDGSAKPLVLGTLRVPWKMELGAIV